MSKKSRKWINEHESWWNEDKTQTLMFKHLERILDDYERELRLSNVSKRWTHRSFIVGIGCGMVLGLMLALIIINAC